MISGFLSADFLLNHLWQSTLFAAAAALLTLLFRKNHARIRYALWLAASIKFLVPFSLFIAIGSSIDFGPQQSVSIAQPALTFVEDISRPFNSEDPLQAIPAAAKPDWSRFIWTPAIAMWLVGCLVFLAFYLAKSWRIRALVRKASPITCGRAFEALQRLEQTIGRRVQIKLASSNSSMEPGVFGIFRPVLLMPSGMSERLSDSELEAILAHELAHVRRRDNLMSSVHMFIEALFWFHPMIWWIGAKLVQEREHACDEEVLRLGKDPQAYAEGILKVCEFYLESPLACVAGVTGADMKERIHAIMTSHIGRKLDLTKKLLLACVGISALAVPLSIGLLTASSSRAQSQDSPKPSFEVASVKPSQQKQGMSARTEHGRIALNGVTLKYLISNAYEIEDYQLSGLPGWAETDIYSIEAKAANPETSDSQMRLMLQSLLEERFKLKSHREEREKSTYSLVIAKSGHKLKKASEEIGGTFSGGIGPDGKIHIMDANGKTIAAGPKDRVKRQHNLTFFGGTSIQDLAKTLSRILQPRNVIDKTGLTGRYEIYLDWGAETGQADLSAGSSSTAPAPRGEFSDLSIFTAIQEQLGLTLEPDKGPVELLVVDSVEKPLEN
jgi:bla regulator protein blaR1